MEGEWWDGMNCQAHWNRIGAFKHRLSVWIVSCPGQIVQYLADNTCPEPRGKWERAVGLVRKEKLIERGGISLVKKKDKIAIG